MATILVVEDEESIRTLLRLMLTRVGYHVQLARNGQDALAQWAEAPADLILLDLNLPLVPGWEVCRHIREMSAVPIIIITGQAATDGAAAVVAPLATAFLLKPFFIEDLLAMIAVLLAQVPLSNAV